MDFAPRLNLLTGDNGLGKTFVLDTIWWILTRTWAEQPILPGRESSFPPKIQSELSDASGKQRQFSSAFDFQSQSWSDQKDRFHPDSLVIYARANGGISVFDPLRNRESKAGAILNQIEDMESFLETPLRKRADAFHFNRKQIWNGLSMGERVLCNGLILDWVIWQYQKEEIFHSFKQVLKLLSPGKGETICPDKPMRVSVEDARDIPAVKLSYGQVPITHISAGMRRILSIAYIMVWAWTEHREAARLMNRKPAKEFLLLLDEAEAHLHPQWQRTLLPALFKVIETVEPGLETQMIVSTHAPLIPASVETEFCEDTDRLFSFNLIDGKVSVKQIPWAKQGDVVNWLVSDAFRLHQGRSAEAEKAIEAAEAFMLGKTDELPDKLKIKEAIHKELQRVLPGHDQFWPRWIVETKGGKS
ncbi:AAA family ATPase [Desulfonema limicola]|nr:AAA family ATPase [Desulfonema limicola]